MGVALGVIYQGHGVFVLYKGLFGTVMVSKKKQTKKNTRNDPGVKSQFISYLFLKPKTRDSIHSFQFSSSGCHETEEPVGVLERNIGWLGLCQNDCRLICLNCIHPQN